MGAPAVGTVVDGYRYNGGNPNDQNSWEELPKAPTGFMYKPGGAELEAIPGGPGDLAGAEIRGRVKLGLPPSVDAERKMENMQYRWDESKKTWLRDEKGNRVPRNPYRDHTIASTIDGAPFLGGFGDNMGRVIGGQDYQDYDQASKTFESSLLPVFSGSAVTDSEAGRFIRANLPTYGDSPETLQTKAKNRKMILNAAAKMGGMPIPFGDIPTWGVTPRQPAAPQPQAMEDLKARAPKQSGSIDSIVNKYLKK